MALFDRSSNHSNYSFLSGGGEMGKLIREKDWSKTPLGKANTWPQSLRTTLSILLSSKFPMFLWWGEDLIQFYNDAYRPSLGNEGKHPTALGQKGKDCWPEIWPIIYPLMERVLTTGEATWSEDALVPIYRNGKIEDVYWTFSYSPVRDESGHIAGVFVTCSETTQNVFMFKKGEKSKDELDFAVEAAQLATWDFNPIANTFTANARYSEWFGIEAEAETDNDLALQVIAQEDRKRVIAAYTQALTSPQQTPYDIEYTIRPLNKPERILHAKGKAFFNEENIANRFNGTLQDVTLQVTARKQLEESEAKLRSIIAAAPVGIGLFMGRDLIIAYPNQTFVDIVGKGWDIVGKPLREAMPELITENQPFLQILDEVYTSGEMFQSFGSQVMIVQHGVMTDNYYNITYTPLLDAQGKVYAILDIAVDVTGEIKSRKRIEESEHQIRALIESAPFPIGVFIGKERRIQLANQVMLDTWGKGNDVIGKLFDQILPELDNQEIFSQLDGVYNTGVAFHAKNQRVDLMIEGKLQAFYFNYSFTPLLDAQGKVYGVMNTAADVTDLALARAKSLESEREAQQLAEELAATNEELASANEEISANSEDMRTVNEQLLRTNVDLDNFIYTASHDLKAPISNIESLLSALIRTLPSEILSSERTGRITTMMRESVERFKRTIANLTEVVKLQKENNREAVSVNLREVIEEVSLDLTPQIKAARAKVKIDVASCPSVHFSEKNLRSVIYNLLSNAIKYRASDRVVEVTIHCKCILNYHVLTITDNGLGMESGRLSQLFTMFKRFHDHVEGSGIGLYMVKKMVENAGGKIEVDSQVGKGSSFQVYFPR